MKMRKRIILIFGVLIAIFFMVFPGVSQASDDFVRGVFYDKSSTANMYSVWSIYKAIFEGDYRNFGEVPTGSQHSWLNGRYADENGNYRQKVPYAPMPLNGAPSWEGQHFLDSREEEILHVNDDQIWESRYAACVGHTGECTDIDNKIVRVLNINIPNSSAGYQYPDQGEGTFPATKDKVYTLALLAKRAVEAKENRHDLIKFFYEHGADFLKGDDIDARQLFQDASQDPGEYGTDYTQVARRATEIVNTTLQTESNSYDGKYREIYYQNGYSFIGPYQITTDGSNGEHTYENRKCIDTLSFDARVQDIDGNWIDMKELKQYSYGDNMNWIHNMSDDTKIDSDNVFLAIPGQYRRIDEIKMYRSYYDVKARVVYTLALSGQNFIFFYGDTYIKTIDINLPGVEKSSKIIMKKVDADDTNLQLTNTKFIVKNMDNNAWVIEGTPTRFTSDQSKATVYTGGQATISNIKTPGTYKFYEIQRENDFYGYASSTQSVGTQSVELGGYNYPLTITNQKKYSHMTIQKTDLHTGATLNDVRIIVKYQGTNQWLKSGWELTSDIKQATWYKSGDKIRDITRAGNYEFWEVQRENEFYEYAGINNAKKIATFYVKIGENKTIPLTNEKKYSHLTITKKDEDSGKPLANIGFILYSKSKRAYVKSGTPATYVSKEKATEFRTNNSGQVEVRDLSIGGDYVIYETYNPYFGYEPVSRSNAQEKLTFNLTIGVKKPITVTNKRLYVKVKGYAWEDRTTTGSTKNYWDTKADKRLQNVEVRLRKANGTILDTKTTNSNGEYIFGNYDNNSSYKKIKIDDLTGAYVEFIYNGMCYQTVAIDNNAPNGNKAGETSTEKTRATFNNNFATIKNNSAYNTAGAKTATMAYNNNQTNHISKLKYGNAVKYGYTGQAYPIAGVDACYQIPAITTKQNGKILCTNYTADSIRKNALTVIENINLGVQEREQPDIALTKDLEKIKVEINGKDFTYTYAQRTKGFENSDKFANAYTNQSYVREVYQSDYDYSGQNKLKVHVIYQIEMKNQSSSLTTKINQIVDYYDKNYTFEKVGTGLNADGTVIKNDSITTSAIADKNGYGTLIINNNTRLDKGQSGSLYVQFLLTNDKVKTNLNKAINNVAEINSYSVYQGTSVYAGVDKDSNPGSCTPGTKGTYEDDTDASPTLTLKTAAQRQMTGMVFEDKALSQNGKSATGIMTKEIREGDGVYDGKEDGIAGVKVTLKETTGSGKSYEATTGANGIFTIQGYLPGDYTLTYTWGGQTHTKTMNREDETYMVQNYKGTIYPDKDSRTGGDRWWYDGAKNGAKRQSDAWDNYETRKKIDAQIATVNQAHQTEKTINKMDATTPKMSLGVEYETSYNASEGKTSYPYQVKNIDFGIIERARQQLDISKRVKNVKLTLENGQTIVNAIVKENGQLEGEIKGLTYGPPIGDSRDYGFVRLEIDDELIQNATLQVEYEIKVENKGEKDYDFEPYYLYGYNYAKQKNSNLESSIIKMKPDIYDYLDNNILPDQTKESSNQWKEISKEEYNKNYKGKYKEQTIIESYYKFTEEKDTQQNYYKATWKKEENRYTEQFKEWKNEKITKGTSVRDAKIGDKRIIQYLNDTTIAPGDTKSITFDSSKILASTDEIVLNNQIEMTEIHRVGNTGRVPHITSSKTYDQGETITITEPTGQDRSTMIRIIILITSLLGILAIGIIIIKKTKRK